MARWLETQLREARKEVESWSEWKRDAMRQEVLRTGSTAARTRDVGASDVQGRQQPKTRRS